MSDEPTLQNVRALVAEELLGPGAELPVDDETDLIESGLCDSLSLVRLAAMLDERFPERGIASLPVDVDSFGTVSQIHASIAALRPA